MCFTLIIFHNIKKLNISICLLLILPGLSLIKLTLQNLVQFVGLKATSEKGKSVIQVSLMICYQYHNISCKLTS